MKFKNADLIGLPIRIAIGKKGLQDPAGPKAEWKPRAAKEVQLFPLGEVAAELAEAVRAGGGKLRIS